SNTSNKWPLLNNSPCTDISPPSLHDALPIFEALLAADRLPAHDVVAAALVIEVAGPAVLALHRRRRVEAFALTDALAQVLVVVRSEEHTSELQSRENLVCRLLLEEKNINDER